MHILTVVYAPGGAEAVAEVVKIALDRGDTVTVVTLGSHAEDRAAGGAAAVFSRLGIPHRDLRTLQYSGDPCTVPRELADRLLAHQQPGAVLAGCSRDPGGTRYTLEDAIVDAARGAACASVQVIDGWDVWFPRQSGSRADWLSVPDDAARRVIERRGNETRGIVVTGQPSLDALSAAADRSRRVSLRKNLGIDDRTRVILYCGQVSSDNPRTLQWTLSSLASNDRVIFQKHPRDTRDYEPVLKSARGWLVEGAPTGDEVFAIADMCVTHTSTMGLRAAVHGVPVVNILLEGELGDIRELCGGYPLAVLGLSREVSNEPALRAALSDPVASGPAAVRRALMLDGHAAERVHTLLSRRTART